MRPLQIPPDAIMCRSVDMSIMLRTQTKVLPGNRVEISSPQLREGDTVEVTVASPENREKRSAVDIIKSLSGHRLFSTPADVDRYLNEERDSWDR